MNSFYDQEVEKRFEKLKDNDFGAKLVHEKYREENKGSKWNINWEDLPETIKETNRNHLQNIQERLLAIGCRIVLKGTKGALVFFPEDKIHVLARIEHDRWMLEKVSQGWEFGDGLDYDLKQHPSILPWEALPLEEKNKNLSSSRNVISILSKVDLGVVSIL